MRSVARMSEKGGNPFRKDDNRNPNVMCNNNVVVVVIDATKEWTGSSQATVSWTLNSIVETGNRVILLGVLNCIANTRKSSTFLGYMSKLGSDYPDEFRHDEATKKKAEIESKTASIRTICYKKGVHFEVEVKVGLPKLIVVQVAISLRANWVVLSRSLKKEVKFFMDQLSCGLIRMRQNNEGDILRVSQARIEKFGDSPSEGILMNNYYHFDDASVSEFGDNEFFSLELSRPPHLTSHPNIYSQSQIYANRVSEEYHFGPVRNSFNSTREYMEDISNNFSIDIKRAENISNNTFADHDAMIGVLKQEQSETMTTNGSNSADFTSRLSSVSSISGNSKASSCTSLSASGSALDSSLPRPYYEPAHMQTKEGVWMENESIVAEKIMVGVTDTATVPQSSSEGASSSADIVQSLAHHLGQAQMSGSESDVDLVGDPKEKTQKISKLSTQMQSFSIGGGGAGGGASSAPIGYSLRCSICKQGSPVYGQQPKRFTLSELCTATRNFSRENFIAEGGFGFVYRGALQERQTIAVKQNKFVNTQTDDSEFRSEVELLSCAQHRNLVMLLGYCDEEDQRILVYEYACNGSLDWHLSLRNPNPLKWWARHKIAIGTGRALRYLHEECRVGCIVHRDMRPNNILLTHEFEPMVGDFGLARFQPHVNTSIHTRVIGAFGYLAPEYAESGQVSWKTDVYSFGVILLELISGRKAIDISRPSSEQSLTEMARPRLNNKGYYDLVDRRLQGAFDDSQLRCMVHAASLCISRDPLNRPRMSRVLRLLEGVSRDSNEVIDSPLPSMPRMGAEIPYASQDLPSHKPLASTSKSQKPKKLSFPSVIKTPRPKLSYDDM